KLVDTDEDVVAEPKDGDPEGLELESVPAQHLGEDSDLGLLDLNFGGEDISERHAQAEPVDNGFEIKLVEHGSVPQPVPEEPLPGESSDDEFNADKTVALVSEQPI